MDQLVLSFSILLLHLTHFTINGDNIVILQCGTPGSPAHGRVNYPKDVISIGTTANYECDEGYELIGSHSRLCLGDGTWTGIMPFCAIDIALNKPTYSSSTEASGISSKANDGNLSNKQNSNLCFQTKSELSPWWKTDLLKSYEIIGIGITPKDCCDNDLHDIEIRVGNSSTISQNRLCSWHPKGLESGKSKNFSCEHPIVGQYVTIQMAGVEGTLTFCEVSIFTNSEISPSYCYSDNSMTGVRSFDNNCYEFQYQVGKSAPDAEKYCKNHNGSLVGPIDAAKQSFLEAEISRIALPKSMMFWIGLKKDKANIWKWTNGSPLSNSFWNTGQPNNADGQQTCVALESEGNWRWNDVRCNINYLRLICQYNPYTCGSPDVPPNATLIESGFMVGQKIIYRCHKGNKLIGTSERLCQPSGSWSNRAPFCKFIDCGTLSSITNGEVIFSDNTTYYRSHAEYDCLPNNRLIGKKSRMCLESGKWSGEEPICLGMECKEMNKIENGNFTLLNGNLGVGSITEFFCQENYYLVGKKRLKCLENVTWDGKQPICEEKVCSQPETTAYANMNVSGFVVGSIVQYSCQTGHQLRGKSERICQENHEWSDQAPTCPLVNCGLPSIFYNGNFILEGNSTEYGNAIKYFCEEGYRLVGQILRTCLENGSWSDEAPKCIVKICEELKVSDHQTIENDTPTVGSKAIYSCEQGYTLIGTKNRICLKNGSWSDQDPICKPIECSFPPVSKNCNVSVSLNPPTYKTIATYKCNNGFAMSGSPVRICGQDAIWSGMEPNCTEIECPLPEVINNGNVSLSQIPPVYNSTVTYSCFDSYNLSGLQIRQCLENGTWSEFEPKCISNSCDPPTELENSVIVGTEYRVDSIIEYHCVLGYHLQGNFTQICLQNATWSGQPPRCVGIECEVPKAIPNGIVQILQNPPVYKTLVYYSCLENYALVGSAIRMCSENGTWNASEPICISSRCSLLPEVPNAKIIRSAYEINVSIIEYDCNPGYILQGNAVIICQNNGQWKSEPPTCKPKQCEMPSILNGYINVFQIPPTFNTIAEYDCDEGYTLVGTEQRVCMENSLWSEEEPQCKVVDCGPPKIIESTIIDSTVAYSTTYGSSVKYQCKIGYELIGYAIRICLGNGLWSGEDPTCIVVDCGQPIFVEHSIIENSVPYSSIYGSSVQYKCEDGYNLMGQGVHVCLENGTWSGENPLCIGVDCGPPKTVIHGTVENMTSNSYVYGSSVQYKCEYGYDLLGQEVHFCLGNGTWSGEDPMCIEKQCPQPEKEPHMIVQVNKVTVGSQLNYSCEAGYTIAGVTMRTCLVSGDWDGSQPSCEPVECSSPAPIENGKIIFMNGTTYRNVIEYACKEKYQLEGQRFINCKENGKWSDTLPKCIEIPIESCQEPPVHSNMKVSGNNYIINSTIEYFCIPGYILFGFSKRTCLSTKNWSGTIPECFPVDCGTPLDPINGYTILNNRTTTFSSHLHYACRDSYILIGTEWSSCMEDGKWDGPQPKCLLTDALSYSPDIPDNNEISVMGTLKNNLVENYFNEENNFHAESESTFLEKPVLRKYHLQLGLGVGFSIAFLLMVAVGVLILFIIKAKRKLIRNRQAFPMQSLNKDKPVLFYQFQKPQSLDTVA